MVPQRVIENANLVAFSVEEVQFGGTGLFKKLKNYFLLPGGLIRVLVRLPGVQDNVR